MTDRDLTLRNRLTVVRINRAIAQMRLQQETQVTRRLVGELREVCAESRRLRRRGRWLRTTDRPLPRLVKG
jgi:hypothetical protein